MSDKWNPHLAINASEMHHRRNHSTGSRRIQADLYACTRTCTLDKYACVSDVNVHTYDNHDHNSRCADRETSTYCGYKYTMCM